MSEGKHTPTPWRAEGREIMAMKEREICHRRFAETKADRANYKFIVTACNSYAQDQKTIDAMVKALEKAVELIEAIEHQPLYGEAKELVQIHAALALAKEKP